MFNVLLHGMWTNLFLCIHSAEVKFLKLSGSLLSTTQHKLLCCPSIPIITDTPPLWQRLRTTMKDISSALTLTCPVCVPTLQVCSQCSIRFSQPWNSFYNSLVAFCLGERMPATAGEPQFIIFNSTHVVVSSSVHLHVSSPLINWNIRHWRNLHSCPKKWKPPKKLLRATFYSYISQTLLSRTLSGLPSASPDSLSFVYNSTIFFS